MKPPLKLYINNTLITGRIDGLDNFEVTVSQDDTTKSVVQRFSSELTFYDDGYDLIKQQLIDSPNAFYNELNVSVYDECCEKEVFKGRILFDSIDWCEPICAISCNIIELKPEYNCISSKTIWDNENGFLDDGRVKLRYCVAMRPEALYYVLIYFYAIFNILLNAILIPAFVVILAMSWILVGICTIVCAFPGTDCNFASCSEATFSNPTELWDLLTGWLDEMNDRLIMCGWSHPTALVRDYIKNVCDICGLEFQSSILNDPESPYYNTLLFAAQIRKGYKPSYPAGGRLIDQNLPVETLDSLMENHLMPLFNARYWIKDGKLIFERKDYFNGENFWIDTIQLYNDGLILDDKICYSYRDQSPYALATYEYSLEGVDLAANEAKNRFDNVIEWNPPPVSPSQTGRLEKQFLSSQARFVGDQIEEDPWTNIYLNQPILAAIFGSAFQDAQGMMYMSQHTAANYRFLIWDGNSLEDGRIKSIYYDNEIFESVPPPGSFYYYDIRIDENTGNIVPFEVPQGDRFNYPFTFFYDNGNINNLYTEFHIIDNPRLFSQKFFDFNFEFNFSCQNLADFDINKTVKLFKNGQIKYGEIKEIKINFLRRTIAVSGIV